MRAECLQQGKEAGHVNRQQHWASHSFKHVPGFEVWATVDQLAPHQSYSSPAARPLRAAAEAATHDSATCADSTVCFGLILGDQGELAQCQATVQA
jgi:hypothetical protein